MLAILAAGRVVLEPVEGDQSQSFGAAQANVSFRRTLPFGPTERTIGSSR